MKNKLLLTVMAVILLILPLVLFFRQSLAKEEKFAYLTFDDGPTLNTPVILEHLERYGAKATFFVLEERIVMYPEYIKDIIHSKNAIGLHGVSHNDAIYLTDTSPLSEMEKANNSLENIAGIRTHLARVPFGSSYRLSKSQAKNLENGGYILWDWNVDPRDSVGKIIPEKVLANLRRDLAKCKDEPIILFHDRKSTAQLLPLVLEYLTNEGYTMLPISDKQKPVCHMR